MGKGHDEFVNDAVDTDGPADELHLCVFGVVKDEVVSVEVCEPVASYSARDL
jgi:hypothetical protein